jgi:DNA-binding MarR family transcriptional regulator
MTRRLRDRDYEQLLRFRTSLRRVLRWSEQQASAAGLTPAQHQLLLAIRGHPNEKGPTVGEVADYLLLRHHSAVELVDRAERAGLVQRSSDPDDGRVVRLALTREGGRRIEKLTNLTIDELARLGPATASLWRDVE